MPPRTDPGEQVVNEFSEQKEKLIKMEEEYEEVVHTDSDMEPVGPNYFF